MNWYNTLIPYKELEYRPIQYGVCFDYDHISRYRGLRQVVRNANQPERFMALETPNTINRSADVTYYTVPLTEENRLDLIAKKLLGSASYGWVIAYYNGIEDGYTVLEGQRIAVPSSISSLFQSGEILASVPPLTLNLGTE